MLSKALLLLHSYCVPPHQTEHSLEFRIIVPVPVLSRSSDVSREVAVCQRKQEHPPTNKFCPNLHANGGYNSMPHVSCFLFLEESQLRHKQPRKCHQVESPAFHLNLNEFIRSSPAHVIFSRKRSVPDVDSCFGKSVKPTCTCQYVAFACSQVQRAMHLEINTGNNYHLSSPNLLSQRSLLTWTVSVLRAACSMRRILLADFPPLLFPTIKCSSRRTQA